MNISFLNIKNNQELYLIENDNVYTVYTLENLKEILEYIYSSIVVKDIGFYIVKIDRE